MNIEKKNQIGKINFSLQAVADLACMTVTQVYGVVGLVDKAKIAKSLFVFLNKDNFSDGVVVKKTKNGYEISLYVVISKDVKVLEVVSEIQKQVSYTLKRAFDQDFNVVNVFVHGLA